MKKAMLIATLALCGMAAFGQQWAAVLPFEVRNNAISADEALVFYGDFSNRFSRVGRDSGLFSVVPRGDVEKLFRQEAAFQLSDLSDSRKTAEYGKVLNADWLISGSISTAGTRIVFMVSMYIYPEFTHLDGSQVYAGNIDELIDKIPELIGNIQHSMTGGRTHIAQAKSDPAPVPEPKQPPSSRYPGGFNYSTGAKVGYGYLNLLGGLGSFIMGDWAGGLLVGGLQAAGITMMAIDFPQTTSHTTYNATFGRTTTTYEETGGGPAFYIGLVLELCGVIYGYFRPFKYDKPHAYYRASGKKPWQDNPLEHIGVVLLPDSKGVSVVNLSYNLSF